MLGVDGVYLKQNASVVSGDVGAVNATSGPYLAGSQETTIGVGVTVPVTSRVFGDSLKLKQGSTVGDVYTNDLSGDGAVGGSVFTPVSFPLDVTLPAVPVAQPGSTDFDVAQGDSLVLDTGSYGLLKARNDASVTLTGGTYEFSEWDLGDRVTVDVLAPSQIVVAGRVDTGNNSSVTPGVGVEPFDLELTVLGQNGNSGNVGATPKAAKFGIGATVSASVWAPNGTLWLRQNAQGLGQFMGRWVTVGIGAAVERSADEGPNPSLSVELLAPAPGTTVFHLEMVQARVSGEQILNVELRVDGVAVGMLADPDGDATYTAEWDTRAYSDGTVALEAAAVDAAGNVGVSNSVAVTVGNESAGIADRISSDYARDLITVDEYATYGMQSLVNADDLPERYLSSFLVGESGEPADGTQAALTFLKDWDQMSTEVQRGVIELGTLDGPVTGEFTPDEPVAAPAQQAAATTGFTSGDFPDCLEKTEAYVIRTVGFPAPVLPKAFECRTVFDHATVYWNVNSGTFWDVVQIFPPIVVPLRKDSLADFSDNDDSGAGNLVPDYIDRIGNQTDIAWEVYDDMGYSQPESMNVYVSELDYTIDAPGGFVLPGPLVQFDNDSATNEYLPRHELFHVAQYNHMIGDLDVSDLLNFYDGTRWWMEATAEWAAHQTMIGTGAPSAKPVTDNSGLNYSLRLPALLNSPESSLVDVDWLFGLDVPGLRSYGSFIFAEYLDENLAFTGVEPWLGGADAIRRTWDRIGDGVTSTTPQRAVEEVIAESTTGDTLGSVLEGFGMANYLMDEPIHTGYGYEDGDAALWKDRLTAGRPARDPVELSAGVPQVGSSVLSRGGSHYVEFTTVPLGESGKVELTPSTVNGVVYTALRVKTDPVMGAMLCDDGVAPVVSLLPGTATEVLLDGGCDTVTLVATYADLASDTRTAGWQAVYAGGDNLLANPGFESGSSEGWRIFKGDGYPGDTMFGVGGSPVRTGSYAALLTSGEGSNRTVPAGYDQVVQVTPGRTYSGFAWFANSSGSNPDVILEITESDGTVIASNARTVFVDGWQLLDVSFTAPGDTAVFRAGLDGPYGESRGTAIDDAVLVESDIGTLNNRSFDDGLDAWSIVGGTGGTVTAVSGGGITAAELVSQTGLPVGVEQWFNGNGFNAANATVTVDSLDDTQVTLDIWRLDDTVVATWSTTLNSSDGWVTTGDVGWGYQDEDVLVYRITTQGPGAVRVDATFVSLAL